MLRYSALSRFTNKAHCVTACSMFLHFLNDDYFLRVFGSYLDYVFSAAYTWRDSGVQFLHVISMPAVFPP